MGSEAARLDPVIVSARRRSPPGPRRRHVCLAYPISSGPTSVTQRPLRIAVTVAVMPAPATFPPGPEVTVGVRPFPYPPLGCARDGRTWARQAAVQRVQRRVMLSRRGSPPVMRPVKVVAIAADRRRLDHRVRRSRQLTKFGVVRLPQRVCGDRLERPNHELSRVARPPGRSLPTYLGRRGGDGGHDQQRSGEQGNVCDLGHVGMHRQARERFATNSPAENCPGPWSRRFRSFPSGVRRISRRRIECIGCGEPSGPAKNGHSEPPPAAITRSERPRPARPGRAARTFASATAGKLA